MTEIFSIATLSRVSAQLNPELVSYLDDSIASCDSLVDYCFLNKRVIILLISDKYLIIIG